MIETTILKCSEKLLALNFQGSMYGGDHSYPGVKLVTEDQLHCKFPANFRKLVTMLILHIGQL